ncbi:MAG: AMP-binding protein [Pseudomonadota bacterium]
MVRLAEFDSYAEARRRFVWPRSAAHNISEVCAGQWAAREPDRTALVLADGNGHPRTVIYGALEGLASRCANVLAAEGITAGDRVAVHLGQRLETVFVHLAIYKLGAVAVPLAAVFGPDAIAFRLAHAGAKLLITSADGAEQLADLGTPILNADREGPGRRLSTLMDRASDVCPARRTGPDDPALMIFTSGTTGQPKGALHGHRVLLGHLPGVQMHHDLAPQPGDRLWTPADWAWAGGLLNVLLPGLAMGIPVVAQRTPRFDPQEALDWAAQAGVRNAFIPPTALRMMRDTTPKVAFRSVASGGEQLGAATFDWGKERLGLTINEFYGQTECNLVLSSCSAWGIGRAGIIGKPVPGHDVAILREDGSPCARGEQGTIAMAAPDPVMFLRYWDDPAATKAKFIGRYMLTGDQGVDNGDGDGVRFVGRDDDVISSAGYRIGPGEIESCLAGHPAVQLAAVVGKPDPLRGEIVTAFVKLSERFSPNERLAEEIAQFVKARLSAHEYPREVKFVDDVPLTSTGKVIRRVFRA